MRCWGCGMFWMWYVSDLDAWDMNVWDVRCLYVKSFGCEMFDVWDICLDEGCCFTKHLI